MKSLFCFLKGTLWKQRSHRSKSGTTGCFHFIVSLFRHAIHFGEGGATFERGEDANATLVFLAASCFLVQASNSEVFSVEDCIKRLFDKIISKSLDFSVLSCIMDIYEKYMNRPQRERIIHDLEKKMVFLVGPRQVGKTWLSRQISECFQNSVYLNYDRAEDRRIMKSESWPYDTELLVLDELHKMKGWKNYLKGVFDTKASTMKILVTGSARLDTFRRAGDSLAGRFFVHRLLPFSLAELKNVNPAISLDHLVERGGFPEPLLAKTKEDAARWRNQYVDGLIRTDILDFETVHSLRALQMIFELLRQRVGSPISFSSIALDVQISPLTVKKYIEILEALFIVFRVTPYSKNIARAILKEPKIYFFDTGLVDGDAGATFENFTALSLLKHSFAKEDATGIRCGLHYIRTKEGKEVDFALTEDGEVAEIIEVKSSDSSLDKNLKYFSEKYGLKSTQIVKSLKREQSLPLGDIVTAEKYLKKLFL